MRTLAEEELETKAVFPHKWATNTTTTGEEEGIDASQPESSRTGVSRMAVLAVSFFPLFQPLPRTPTALCLEGLVEQIGVTSETVDVMVPWLGQREVSESEQNVLRGTFAPPSERDILFTVSFNLESSHLRRWSPEISLDRRSLDQEDA